MRIGPATLVLPTATLLLLLTSCSNYNLGSNQGGSAPSPDKKTPVVTWAQPVSITTDTPLSAQQLNATANVAGIFVYTPVAGTLLGVGTQKLSAVFTPTDTADYGSASASVSLVVTPAPGQPIGGGSNCDGGLSKGVDTFVYVSTGDQQNPNYQIQGFAVAKDGSLTPVAGSPFATPAVAPMGTVGRGSNLFGADSYKIYSFAIHSDGCISLESSLVAGRSAGTGNYGEAIYYGPTSLFFDPKYEDLYSSVFVPAEEGYYASFSFDGNTAQVTPINATPTNSVNEYPLTIASNDKYAVSTTCYFRVGKVISEFQRDSSGALNFFKYGPFPAAAPGNGYCPWGASADQSNHIVIEVQPFAEC